MCQYGQGLVRGLFQEFDIDNLKGFAVWLPAMAGDDLESADKEAAAFSNLRVSHTWDSERILGDLFSEVLNIEGSAWDVYFLYAPGVRWDGEQPPLPTFWMHQLPASAGTDWRLQLNAGAISEELLKLLGSEVQPRSGDLVFEIHAKGILNLTREKGWGSVDDIRQAVEELGGARTGASMAL